MRIYIAGPYSSDPEGNTDEAIRIGNRVKDIGHTPFIPHLTHFWEQRHSRPYEEWLKYDLEWLECCQCLLRFPGESSGADREVEYAKAHKPKPIPVYYYPDDMPILEAL